MKRRTASKAPRTSRPSLGPSACSRRDFLGTLALGAAGLGATGLGAAGCAADQDLSRKKEGGDRPSGRRAPNILFIMLDDLGPEWISCYGGEEMTTPNIDALAKGGMRFEHAYAMPKCTPTRATLLTGQYPFRTGWINHWDVPRFGCGCHFDGNLYTTFAQVMRRAGYLTAVAGKWQINDFRVQPDALEWMGFDDYCMWTGYETGNPPSGKRYWNPYIHTKEGSRTYEGLFGEDVFTRFLIDFMGRNRERPMLLYYPMCLPHTPLTTTPLERKVAGKEETFKAMVRYADHQVGRIVAALTHLGIREDTILFLTSDNGTAGGFTARMNGRSIKGGKGKLNESGIRVPFIVNGKGRVPAGTVTDALTDFSDLLPTFAELAGTKPPGGAVLDGRSIAGVLLGEEKDSRREWIMAMGGGVARFDGARVVSQKEYADRVVRDKRFKLWIIDGKSAGLFDLAADPGEKNNLIDMKDPGIQAARKKLEAAVGTFPQKDASPKYEPLPTQPWDRFSREGEKPERKG